MDLPIDGRVLAFSAAAVLFATLAFGLAPALQAVRPSLADALKDGSIAPRQRGRLRGALVATQVALSVVLLVTSGLFVRTLLAAANVAPGFATHDVLSVHVALADDAAPASHAYFETLMERVAAVPGVQSVSLAAAVPLAGGARRSVCSGPRAASPLRSRSGSRGPPSRWRRRCGAKQPPSIRAP